MELKFMYNIVLRYELNNQQKGHMQRRKMKNLGWMMIFIQKIFNEDMKILFKWNFYVKIIQEVSQEKASKASNFTFEKAQVKTLRVYS